MFIINILGFLVLSFFLAYRYKEKLVVIMPVSTGIWIMILYILAFFQKMHKVDWICVVIIVLGAVYTYRNKEAVKEFVKCNMDASVIMMVVIYFLVYCFMCRRLACSGDELGVWAIEIKDIYYVNGFADKYKNISMGYSDYFPGLMIFGWWTCHFSPKIFKEGLMYVGIWWLFVSYLMPVLAKVQVKRKYAVLWGGFFFGLFMLLPGVVEIIGYTMLQAELPLSTAFAGCLWSYFDTDEHKKEFVIVRSLSYMFSLFIFKESGIIFAVMALLFGILLLHLCRSNQNGRKRNVQQLNYLWLAGLGVLSFLPVLVWKIYCKAYERTKYFTNIFQNTFADIRENNYTISDLAEPLIQSFFQSLYSEPLHINKTLGLDLTVIGFVIFIGLLFYYCYRKTYMNKTEWKVFFMYYIGMLVIYLLLLLCMHIFIFQENGYVDPNVMMMSIARYAEPLFLGVLIFAFMVLMTETEELTWKNFAQSKVMVFTCIVFLCTNLPTAVQHIFQYGERNKITLKERREVAEKSRGFYTELDDKLDMREQGRILWVRSEDSALDGSEYRRISFLLAPKSVITYNLNTEQKSVEEFAVDISYMIKGSHCQYVYFDEIEPVYFGSIYGLENSELKNNLLEAVMDGNQNITFRKLE